MQLRTRLLPLLMLPLILGTTPVLAKSGADAVTFLESELLFLELGFFSASPKIRKSGKIQNLGFFGQNYDRVFAGSPAALDAARRYRNMRIAGFTLSVVGMTALIVDLVLIAAESKAALDKTKSGFSRIKPLGWALLGVGAAVGLTGGLLVSGAGSSLSRAVRHYNDDVFKRARMRWSFNVAPIPGGALASLALTY